MNFIKINTFPAILIMLAFSCKINNKQYGKRIIQKSDDTTTLQKTIVNIRSLQNELFDSASFSSIENIKIKYRLSKPETYTPETAWPLIVVFHGSGAIGTDNSSQLGVLAKLFTMPEIQSKYPAYVLAPQFPARSSNYVLDTSRNVLASAPQNCIYAALQLIDSLKTVLNIDEKRIYAVGFSMGGSTVINALSVRPNLFAAGVSIGGIPQFDSIKSISKTPIWLMHGNRDNENPIASDEQFYKEVSVKNKTRFWIFDQTQHQDIFTTAILGDNIPKWLFSKKKN